VARSSALRYAPLLGVAAGALALVVAELLTLREIRTAAVVPAGGTVTGGSHHHYALALIGLAMLPMAFGAGVRGARPAAVALLVLSLVAAYVVLVVDRPSLDDTGLLGRTYELAEARPGAGFYVESLGVALALVGAVGALVLGRAPAVRSPAAR
jgi:hypothetical protein